MAVPFIGRIIITTVAGAAVGGVIPYIAKEVVAYKCQQRGKPVIRKQLPQWVALLCAVLLALIASFVVACNGLGVEGTFHYASLFVIIFTTIAMIVSLIDCQIHLIPNEGVLLLLGLGIIYRILYEGLPGLLNALLALGIAILVFGGSSAAFFYLKKRSGLGAGDLKYAFAISVIVGTSGMIYFLAGMAIAIIIYLFIGMRQRLLLMTDYFPMAAHLSFGFLVALLVPYIEVAKEIAVRFF